MKWDNIYKFMIMGIYLVITAVFVYHHEPWSDEAQAWLIARDLNFIEIFKQMVYEGHSCFWHLVLVPFAKLRVPYEIINYVSFALVSIGVWLIITKSPFNKIIKVIIIFSAPFLYYHSVIARCYALIPMILCWIAIYYPKRGQKRYIYCILLALLANTHLIMIPVSGILILEYIYDEIIPNKDKSDKKNKIIAICIAIFGILLYIIQVRNALTTCNLVQNLEYVKEISSISDIFRLMLESFHYIFKYVIGENTNTIILYIFELLVIIPIIIASFRNMRQGIVFWAWFGFSVILQAVIWFVLPQRAVVIILMIMFFAWNNYNDLYIKGKKLKWYDKIIYIPLIILCICSLVNILKIAYRDVVENYSCAKEVANYIERLVPKHSTFICPSMQKTNAVIPYLKKGDYNFYSVTRNEYFSFVIWDENWIKDISFEEMINSINNIMQVKEDGTNIYIILWKYDIRLLDKLKANGIIQTFYESGINDRIDYSIYEEYYIYIVNEDKVRSLKGE